MSEMTTQEMLTALDGELPPTRSQRNAIAARLKALEDAASLAVSANEVLKKVQALTSMYLEPGDNRLVLDDETINAIIAATDNAAICRLQRRIAILDAAREVEK